MKDDSSTQSATNRRKRWNPLIDCEKHKFRVQNSPPLSIRQFYRSTITVIPGGEHWKPSGIYHPPVIHEDSFSASEDSASKVCVASHKNSKPAWCPSGFVKYAQSSLSNDEKKHQKSEHDTIDSRKETNSKFRSEGTKKLAHPWRPSGIKKYDPVPYFDAPSLRWNLQDVKESMSEFESRTNNTTKNRK